MRILIAEDEVATARALKLLLEKSKYSVDIVHTGTDAWDYISAGSYEVVVLDIMMPGMSGLEVLSLMRQAEKFGNDQDAVDLIAADMLDCFVRKGRQYAARYPGFIFPPCVGTFSWVISIGKRIAASADGRESGEYFAESALYEADADGRNWRRLPHTFRLPQPGRSETGLQEPGIAELPDGRLYAYFRTDRAFQYESVSADGGETWTVPTQSLFTSPESPMLISRNPFSGLYYAFWNPIPLYNGRIAPDSPWIDAGRSPFVMAVSENGVDYSPFVVLEDDPTHGYCYPAVNFLSEKELLLSYCCGGPADGTCLTRTRILHLQIE